MLEKAEFQTGLDPAVHRPKPFNAWIFLALVLIGLGWGLIVLRFVSWRDGLDMGDPWFFIRRQLIWLAIAAGLFLLVQAAPWEKLSRLFWLWIGLGLALYGMVHYLLPFEWVRMERWLAAGQVRVDTKLLAMLCYGLALCSFLSVEAHWDKRQKMKLATLVLCVVLTRNFTLEFLIAASILLFAAGRRRAGALFSAMAATLGVYWILRCPYFLVHFGRSMLTGPTTWFGHAPWALPPQGYGALVDGDGLVAYIAYQLGWAGLLGLTLWDATFVAFGFRAARNAENRFTRNLVTYYTTFFGLMVLFSSTSTFGFFNFQAVLPFFSYGGISVLTGGIGTAFIFRALRQSRGGGADGETGQALGAGEA